MNSIQNFIKESFVNEEKLLKGRKQIFCIAKTGEVFLNHDSIYIAPNIFGLIGGEIAKNPINNKKAFYKVFNREDDLEEIIPKVIEDLEKYGAKYKKCIDNLKNGNYINCIDEQIIDIKNK